MKFLGKDVILLILHEAATDYETFCNVRLVAKWVARTMSISAASLQSSPKHENWRLMVEDAALRRVEQNVKKTRDLYLYDSAGVDGSISFHDGNYHCEVNFERDAKEYLLCCVRYYTNTYTPLGVSSFGGVYLRSISHKDGRFTITVQGQKKQN
jgi:hypothetical protein